MPNPESVQEKKTHKLLWNLDIQTDPLISTRQPDFIIINKKERTCKIVNFAVRADRRVKLKECEKRDKYFNLARELKKLWNVKIILIVIGTLGTVTNGFVQDLVWFRCLMAYRPSLILMPKHYLTHSWEDERVHAFRRGICPKVNITAQIEFELAYYDSAVQRFNHYTALEITGQV